MAGAHTAMKMMTRPAFVALATVVFVFPSQAQMPSPAEPAASAPAVATVPIIPAKTEAVINILAEIDSKTSARGDMFPIRLTDPILIDGKIAVPAGTSGQGEVVHAAKARAAGKAGELIVAARYLQCGATRIPLGHLKLGVTGQRRVDEAAAAAAIVAAPVALFITGGQARVAFGTSGAVKVTADVPLPTLPCAGDAPTPIQQGEPQ